MKLVTLSFLAGMAIEVKSYDDNLQMHRMLDIPGPSCPDTGSWQLAFPPPCVCVGSYPGGSTTFVTPTCPEGVFNGTSCTCACPDNEIFNENTGKCEAIPPPPPPPGVDPSCPDTGSWQLVKDPSPCQCLGYYSPGGSTTLVSPTCPEGLYYADDLCRCSCLGQIFDEDTNKCMDGVPVVSPGTTMPKTDKTKSGKTKSGKSDHSSSMPTTEIPKSGKSADTTTSSKSDKSGKSAKSDLN